MGSYLSIFNPMNYFKEEKVVEIIEDKRYKNENETKPLISLKLSYKTNISINEILQFPSGNILATAIEGIHIFDMNFNLLYKIQKKANHIYIKDDNIFATFDENIINIWDIEYENNNIKIKLIDEIIHKGVKGEINREPMFYDIIYNIVIIDNDDIIGNDFKSIFTYKKAKKEKNFFFLCILFIRKQV